MEWIRTIWADIELYIKLISFVVVTILGAVLGFFYVKRVRIPEIEKNVSSLDKKLNESVSDIASDIGGLKVKVNRLIDKDYELSNRRPNYVIWPDLRKYCKECQLLCQERSDMRNAAVMTSLDSLQAHIIEIGNSLKHSEEKRTQGSKALFEFMKAVKKDNCKLDFDPDRHIDTYFGQ